jgi:uncharacterized protein YdeI (YjbR/CyaY-like superfamily)
MLPVPFKTIFFSVASFCGVVFCFINMAKVVNWAMPTVHAEEIKMTFLILGLISGFLCAFILGRLYFDSDEAKVDRVRFVADAELQEQKRHLVRKKELKEFAATIDPSHQLEEGKQHPEESHHHKARVPDGVYGR